jgi:hypothetical protein
MRILEQMLALARGNPKNIFAADWADAEPRQDAFGRKQRAYSTWNGSRASSYGASSIKMTGALLRPHADGAHSHNGGPCRHAPKSSPPFCMRRCSTCWNR